MKKIMFNDRYGLTEAVLSGRKTQTRRIASKFIPDAIQIGYNRLEIFNGKELRCYNEAGAFIKYKLPYQIGEVVAVAQSYKDAGYDFCMSQAAYINKMFTKAEYMPHQIRITNVRVERLQDISDDDCIKEGVGISATDNRIGRPFGIPFKYYVGEDKKGCRYSTPREAYAAIINRIASKGVWESNPYVFVYDFELLK